MIAPPFDDLARAEAQAVVSHCQHPPSAKPREQGLRAIHAVLHRDCFDNDEKAWDFFGSSHRQTLL